MRTDGYRRAESQLSEICLDLGVGKPLPLSQPEIGGVRFVQDIDE